MLCSVAVLPEETRLRSPNKRHILTKIASVCLLNTLDTENTQTNRGGGSMETGRNDNFAEEKTKIVAESGYLPYMEMKVT